MTLLLVGLFTGALIGFAVAAIMAAAGRRTHHEEHRTIAEILEEMAERDAGFYRLSAKNSLEQMVWCCVVTRGKSADVLAKALGLREE